MIINEQKRMDGSNQNGVAPKPIDAFLSRSVSSCSVDDHFLPTFESEDYDWRTFGWLLDNNNIELPCMEAIRKLSEDQRSAKLDDNKQLSNETSIAKCGGELNVNERKRAASVHVDPTEFYLTDEETDSAVDDEATRAYVGNGFMQKEQEAVVKSEKSIRNSVDALSKEPQTERTTESNDREEEPVAKRTRRASRRGEFCDANSAPQTAVVPPPKQEAVVEKHDDEGSECGFQGPPSLRSRQCTPCPMSEERKEGSDPIARRTRRRRRCVTKKRTNEEGKGTTKMRSSRIPKRKYTKRLYCLCETPYDRTRLYVGCDLCNGWFHPECIGISHMEAVKSSNFFCPNCVKCIAAVDDG